MFSRLRVFPGLNVDADVSLDVVEDLPEFLHRSLQYNLFFVS